MTTIYTREFKSRGDLFTEIRLDFEFCSMYIPRMCHYFLRVLTDHAKGISYMAADVCILLLLHLFKPLFEVHIRERSYTSRERVSYHIASGMLISYALHMNKHATQHPHGFLRSGGYRRRHDVNVVLVTSVRVHRQIGECE